MKINTIRMFLALGAASICGALHAQTYNLAAKVPFAFQTANHVFPAGNYLEADYGATGVPMLKNATTGQAVFVTGATHSLDAVRPGRLVFHCYGAEVCFLAEIRPATGYGSIVAKTKAEKEILKGDRASEMATIYVDLHRAD